MCKKRLFFRKEKMSLVEEASKWNVDLINSEARGPGNFGNAMRRVARRIGVSHSKLWALRYRKPKVIIADVYLALRDAWEDERKRGLGKLAYEAKLTAEKAGPDAHSVRAALAVLDADDCETTKQKGQ
jgi:hypothetical protein